MRRLKIGLCISPFWARGAKWRLPDSRVEEIFSPGLQLEMASLAEAAHLDFLWKPDSLLLDPRALETGPALSSLEPVTLMGLLAASTRRIGLIPSVSSVYAQPYTLARQLQTLDLLSEGRVGWNVVSSLGGGDNYASQPRPVDPVANAHDFIEAVEGLRQSYPAESLKMDRASGQFADVARIRRVAKVGRYPAAGPLTTPARSEQRLPLLHAGAVQRISGFVARHASAVFVTQEDVEMGQAQVRYLDDAAESLGLRRRPLVLAGLALCLADSAAEAAALAGKNDHDQLPHGARHWRVVGTVGDAVNAIVARARAGVVDGLLLLPTGSWRSLELFTTQVVPSLAALGLFRESYGATTLAGHLAED